MTIQQALSLCIDPYEPMFLWNIVKRQCLRAEVNGIPYQLQWIMVDPDSLKRIYINTLGPATDRKALWQLVQKESRMLREDHWDTLRSDNPLYGADDWCCGTCLECADWLMTELNTKRIIGL